MCHILFTLDWVRWPETTSASIAIHYRRMHFRSIAGKQNSCRHRKFHDVGRRRYGNRVGNLEFYSQSRYWNSRTIFHCTFADTFTCTKYPICGIRQLDSSLPCLADGFWVWHSRTAAWRARRWFIWMKRSESSTPTYFHRRLPNDWDSKTPHFWKRISP